MARYNAWILSLAVCLAWSSNALSARAQDESAPMDEESIAAEPRAYDDGEAAETATDSYPTDGAGAYEQQQYDDNAAAQGDEPTAQTAKAPGMLPTRSAPSDPEMI